MVNRNDEYVIPINDDLLIKENETVSVAIEKMNKNTFQILLVVNSDDCLIGTLTDGDIRNKVFVNNDLHLETEVSVICNKSPKYINDFSIIEAKKKMKEFNVSRIPILNRSGIPIGIYKLENLFFQEEEIENVPIIIMAGGKGVRLQPITNIIPKPLIPLNDKPIVEVIMDKFEEKGFKKFFMSINYKKELIKSYFSENEKYSDKLEFIEEKEFYGTAGSLSVLKNKINNTFFVSNCDIIANFDYIEALKYHKKNKYNFTIIGAIQKINVPYGVIKFEEDSFRTIEEKPEYNFIVNTGIYILEPDTLDYIPENSIFHMTDLIKELKDNGKNIGVYTIQKKWTDIGNWDDLKKQFPY